MRSRKVYQLARTPEESRPPIAAKKSDAKNPLAPRPFAPESETEAIAPSSNNVEILKANLERASRGAYHAADVLPLPNHNPQPIRIQTKLTIGAPGDKYEQEADRVAQQVVSQLNAPTELSNGVGDAAQRTDVPDEDELMMKPLSESIQRQDLPEDEDELMMKPQIQRQVGLGGTAASEDIEQAIAGQRGKGQALDDTIRQPMEQAFGADFSSVKVHTDGKSDRLNHSLQAKAFTTGQDVFFRQGSYQPNSRTGQELLAHELTHVVQQSDDTVRRSGKLTSLSRLPQKIARRQVKVRTLQRAEKKNDLGEWEPYDLDISSLSQEEIDEIRKKLHTLFRPEGTIKLTRSELFELNKRESLLYHSEEQVQARAEKALRDDREKLEALGQLLAKNEEWDLIGSPSHMGASSFSGNLMNWEQRFSVGGVEGVIHLHFNTDLKSEMSEGTLGRAHIKTQLTSKAGYKEVPEDMLKAAIKALPKG